MVQNQLPQWRPRDPTERGEVRLASNGDPLSVDLNLDGLPLY
jgi:hypothetical protein